MFDSNRGRRAWHYPRSANFCAMRRRAAWCCWPRRRWRSSSPIRRWPTTTCGSSSCTVSLKLGALGLDKSLRPLDQRRPDGDLLFPGRPRDQARADRGRAVEPAPGGPAGDRRRRRHGGAGPGLCRCSTRRRRKRCAAGRSRPPPTSRSPWAWSACSATAVPASLKIFLLALAIIDDLGAIVIIAIFYTADLSLLSLGLAAVGIAVLVAHEPPRACSASPPMCWSASCLGVRAEIGRARDAGRHHRRAVRPAALAKRRGTSLAKRCIHALHPWVAFAIMPAFAFANAGVSLTGLVVGDHRRTGHAGRGAGPVHRQAGRA